MAVIVSIRATRPDSEFVARWKSGNFELPAECSHNAGLFEELLRIMFKVVPALEQTSDKTRRQTAEVMAYVLRPDLLRTHTNPHQKYYEFYRPQRKLHEGKPLKLRRSPEELQEGYLFPREKMSSGPPEIYEVYTAIEFFRCLGAAYDKVEKLREAIEYGDTFNMADAMAYIVNPRCFSDYAYTPEILQQYREDLQYDFDTI